MTVVLAPMIVADREVLGGKPRVKGTRISVAQIVTEMSYGRTVEEVVDAYPSLTREGVLACLAYAAETLELDSILFSAA
jgi:uncharacterized protein (DUF433 family)